MSTTARADLIPNVVHLGWEATFAERASTSAKIHRDALRVLAGGMTHDIRHTFPFPLAIERSLGARKWDVDGNEYVDYVVGHGALLLGHAHPDLVNAVTDQVRRGTHYGAAHRSEVEWAELVSSLIPSAERVRFTSSGTEAVLLAARLARAFTGRPKIVKFHVHFHGWSEVGVVGLAEPFDVPVSPGIPSAMADDVVAVSPRDSEHIESVLDAGDVAAVILEPSGAHFGQVPVDDSFLRFVRQATATRGVLLIFDEVITGFRWSPGGAQARSGVLPDLTTLAKILGGGLPSGAVAGSAEVMEAFAIRGEADWDRYRHVYHPGTFNANPLSAAAGVAALRHISSEPVTSYVDAVADRLRTQLNDVLARRGIPGVVYGDSSVFHIYLGPVPGESGEERDSAFALMRGPLGQALRCALLANGVDLLVSGGMLSSAHGDREVAETAKAFDAAVTALAASGLVPES